MSGISAYPVESLVLMTVRGGAVGCVLRLDLGALGRGAFERLAELAASNDADGAIAVIVSERVGQDADCGSEFQVLQRDLAKALKRHGVGVIGAYAVDRIAAGGRWHCVDEPGVSGVLEDPAQSVVAAGAVFDGRRLYASRDEMNALVAVDYERQAAVEDLLGSGGSGVDCVATAVSSAVAAVKRLAAGERITDAEIAGIGATLTDCRVRDQLFTTAESDVAGPAEALWLLLARALPTAFRAEALTLVSFSAYVRGDGVLAGIAVAAVLAESPSHRMAGMLDIALQAGIGPAEIRSLVAAIPSAVTI